MESGRSETGRRILRRRPLVDVSNTAASSSVLTLSGKLKAKAGAKPKPRATAVPDGAETSSIGSCNSANPLGRKIGSSPVSSKVAGRSGNSGVPESAIPCSRQRERKQKGKRKTDEEAEAHNLSCPSGKRARSTGENQATEPAEDVDRLRSSSVPYVKPKRKWRYILSSDGENQPQAVLPKQFVEEQRAYYAEVDAFELAEEVVSEAELE